MKWKWLVLGIPLLPIAVLAFLNVRDYRRYKFITELERHVTPEQFAVMARVCEGRDKREYRDTEVPKAYAVLGAESVNIGDRSAEAKLYDRGHAYAYLQLRVSACNQKALVFYDFDGRGQQGRDVWLKDTKAEELFHPTDRVLTLLVWTFGPDREYVVTKDSLIVFSRDSGWSKVVGQRRLLEVDVRRVRDAIGRIGSETRGRAYKAGSLDGCTMVYRLSVDGTPSDQDILVENTWCEALNEVTAVLAELAPAECPLPPREWMQSPGRDGTPQIIPISEVNRSDVQLDYPRWLFWPRLVLGVKG
ncbi:MAG: hypothetical protein IPL39_05495 [Opitutaceae bacterium]|nr:hypothetical protein [Opitutaceae bacterium]